jgi:hypothetical protein
LCFFVHMCLPLLTTPVTFAFDQQGCMPSFEQASRLSLSLSPTCLYLANITALSCIG